MTEYRVSFNRIEDDVATFALYENEGFKKSFIMILMTCPTGSIEHNWMTNSDRN